MNSRRSPWTADTHANPPRLNPGAKSVSHIHAICLPVPRLWNREKRERVPRTRGTLVMLARSYELSELIPNFQGEVRRCKK